MKEKSDIIKKLIAEYGKLIITSNHFGDYLDAKEFFNTMSEGLKAAIISLHKNGFGTIMYRIAQSDPTTLSQNSEWQNHITDFVQNFASQSEYKEEIVNRAAEILINGVLPDGYTYNNSKIFVSSAPKSNNASTSQDPILVSRMRTHRIRLEKATPTPIVDNKSNITSHPSSQPTPNSSAKPTTQPSSQNSSSSSPKSPTQSSSYSPTTSPHAPSKPASPTPKPTSPSSPSPTPKPSLAPSNTNSSHSNFKGIRGKYLVIGAILGVLILIVFAYYHHQYTPYRDSLKIEKKEYTYTTPLTTIFELVDDCYPYGSELSLKGNKKVDSLLSIAPNDYWLLFIKDKKGWTIPEKIKNSILSVDKNATKSTSNKSQPRYIKPEIFHLTLEHNDYLSSDDMKILKNQGLIVEAKKADEAVKQFQKDIGVTPDGKLTKEMIDLLNLWKPMWSSKPLGFRQIKDMNSPGYDSDELIKLLRKAEFFTDSCKLIKRDHIVHMSHNDRAKVILAVAYAKAKDPTDERGTHYDIPKDIEICVRAFQAYHHIKPDGILNEETIRLLNLYK